MVKIFVGNVSNDATPEDLRRLFEKYGVVSECSIIKEYAFVHMENQEEAQEAIDALDDQKFFDLRLVVKESHGLKGQQHQGRRENNGRGGGSETTKIFVGNLSKDARSADLREIFEKFGPVAECACLDKFAFVHMENRNDAMAAISGLDGTELAGLVIDVKLSNKSGGGGDRSGGGHFRGGGGMGGGGGRSGGLENSIKIFVGNLIEPVKSAQLSKLFEQFGRVVACDVLDKFAFVRMTSDKEARHAIRELDDSQFMGNRITVQLSKSQRRPGGRDGGYHDAPGPIRGGRNSMQMGGGGGRRMMGGSDRMMGGSDRMMGGSDRMMGGSDRMMGGSDRMMGGSDRMMGSSGMPPPNIPNLSAWLSSLPLAQAALAQIAGGGAGGCAHCHSHSSAPHNHGSSRNERGSGGRSYYSDSGSSRSHPYRR